MGRGKQQKARIRNACMLALAVLVLLSLAPVLYLGRYARMEGDDYFYGILARRAFAEGRGFVGVARAVWAMIAGTYRDWQGTYAAAALFALQPAIWAERLYGITPYFLIGSLVAGLGYFLRQIGHYVLRAPRYVWLFAWMIAAFLCVQFPRSAAEGFYWYTGGVFYVFFLALMLAAFGAIARWFYGEATGGRLLWRALLLALVSFLLAGGSYPVALLYGVGLLGCLLLSFWKKPRMALPLFAALIVFLAGFLISALAPGNLVRAGFFTEVSLDPVRAIVYALLGVFRRMGGQFFRHRGIFLTLLLIWLPFCLYAQHKPAFRYRLPWLVPILSWLILGAIYTPPFYATGTGGPDRLWNVAVFVFELLLMANLYYFAGWFRQRFERAYNKLYEGMLSIKRVAAPYMALCLVGISLVSGMGPDAFLEREKATAIQAIIEIRDGEAARYAFERDRIREEIEASDQAGVIMIRPLFRTGSKLLPDGDFADSSGQFLAEWYGKGEIVFMPES